MNLNNMRSIALLSLFCWSVFPIVQGQDEKPGAPVHPGQPSNCIAWHTVTQGDDCETVPKKYYITKEEFLSWNPAVSKDCLTNFWLKYAYCVRIDGTSAVYTSARSTETSKTTAITKSDNPASPSSKITSTKDVSSTISTSTKPASGTTSESTVTTSVNTTYSVRNPVSTWNITTPTTDVAWPPKATQSGQPKDCNKWHLVRGRQSCQGVLNIHSSSLKKDDFFKWNPEVHEDCSGLFVGYWYCVGVKLNTTDNLEWETSTPPFTPPSEPTSYTPTKLTPADSDFTPTPSHGPMPTDCIHYHQAEADESCRDILKTYSYLSKDQFFKYNPVLKNNCDGLWKDNWYCVGVKSELLMPPTATTTPSDIPSGSPKDCKAWYYTTGGETCDQLAKMFGTFSADEFISMNPAVFDDCSDIEDNTWYCVAGPDTPITRTASLTTPTQLETAMPTQSNVSSDCKEYWLVSKKDTCKSIRQANSISLEKLLAWNPALGTYRAPFSFIMHRRLKAWMESKRHSRRRTHKDPEMPRLPDPRPYTLTPPPSQERITTLAEMVPLFRLPLELRRKILIHAFGNRTVHMDLVLTHPLREPLNDERSTYRSTKPAHRYHTENMHLYPYTEENLGLDRNQPRYTEGTEVLYGTNTIHIASKPLLTNLSRLVPERSLSLISSLEVVFRLDTEEQQGKAFPKLQQLERDLLILDTHFPSLLRLHIGLRLDLPIIEDNRTSIKRRPAHVFDMLQSIDTFVKRRCEQPQFGQLRDPLLLSIPQSAYEDFQNEVRHNGQYYVRKSGVQVWRPLTPESLVLDDKEQAIALSWWLRSLHTVHGRLGTILPRQPLILKLGISAFSACLLSTSNISTNDISCVPETMKRRFMTWYVAKREKHNGIPEPPTLPTPRPHILTPSPSSDALPQSQQTAPFFQMLPYEIRRQVLIEAFGDRTIHMDLTYNHPPMQGNKRAHAMIQEWRLGLDKSRPKSWYWRGCTCHHKPPPWHPAIATESYSARAVDKDRCCIGLGQCCDMWSKNSKDLYGCWIGAMGWLQTCRQAYTEGIDVLYTTNTIHISSATLLVDLTTYILPQRVSSIRSLEIIWFVETDVCIGKNLPRERDLNAILRILDRHFPDLKRLNLALQLGLSKKVETHVHWLFDTLDSFFIRRVFDCMREPFAVSIPFAVYIELRREIARVQGHEGNVFHWQIWRFFGGEYVLPHKPRVRKSLDTTPGARCNNGYWIYPGQLSVPTGQGAGQGGSQTLG
ncbi:hypothetical protein FANTH_2405 [Fusarium anthophilum]|uniref:LysM domain-containing protein n=1 Tax=Fusarium anthophilum TaxID=48485 RepID=A0A8H4ZUM6_9HYPO|nr:hypothetical protein FANTH_2405 [Fusarium anthophilum]